MTKVPSNAVTLLRSAFQTILPMVDEELTYWERRAEQIPDKELRNQALASIQTKRFHCQGGGIYALLAGEMKKEAVSFIVAYQTISDYLDNLCDRSTSLDPNDFRMLHEAMKDALTPGSDVKNYYLLRNEQDDGGYLAELVGTCQEILKKTTGFATIMEQVWQLEGIYADLQVHKHVKVVERVPRLTNWYEENKSFTPQLSWYEFAAASGSTLGIFCLVGYLLGNKIDKRTAQAIHEGYFPYMQGLHILLDYYIDQLEDSVEGDLNFCSYYADEDQMKGRLLYFIDQSYQHIKHLPDRRFHVLIIQGLVALYFADEKVERIPGSASLRKELLKASGNTARFIYFHIKFYHKMESVGGEK